MTKTSYTPIVIIECFIVGTDMHAVSLYILQHNDDNRDEEKKKNQGPHPPTTLVTENQIFHFYA